MLTKSKSLSALSLAKNLISLESLLKVDINDCWELFFRKFIVQRLRKIQQSSELNRISSNNGASSGGVVDQVSKSCNANSSAVSAVAAGGSASPQTKLPEAEEVLNRKIDIAK